jgi:hypothetical protein
MLTWVGKSLDLQSRLKTTRNCDSAKLPILAPAHFSSHSSKSTSVAKIYTYNKCIRQ